MSRPKPPPPEASHGWTALQTYPDEHVVYAYAGRPCVCGDGNLFHADRFDADTGEMGIGVGRCTNCDSCDVFRPADVAMLAAAALLSTDDLALPGNGGEDGAP